MLGCLQYHVDIGTGMASFLGQKRCLGGSLGQDRVILRGKPVSVSHPSSLLLSCFTGFKACTAAERIRQYTGKRLNCVEHGTDSGGEKSRGAEHWEKRESH